MDRRLASVIAAALAACTSAVESSAPVALRPVWHRDVDLTPAGPDLARAAPAYVTDRAGPLDLGLGPDDDFAVVSVLDGADGLRHARMRQLHAGVPVHGAVVVVDADDTTFLGFHGHLTGNLAGFDVTPDLDRGEAIAIAFDDRAGGAALTCEEPTGELMIVAGDDGRAALVWRVELFNHQQPGFEPARWFYLVDAKTGSIVHAFDGLARSAQASGPGGNPTIGSHRWSDALDVEPTADGQFIMETDAQVTYDLSTQWWPDTAVIGPLDPIGDAAINDAHGFTEMTKAMLWDWYLYNATDFLEYRVESVVHYGHDYDQAFFDGEQVVYGDGGARYYPLSGALDIVAHEIHHAFTEQHSILTHEGMPGALSESFSDMAGVLVELYHHGDAADFTIGEDIVKGGGALRDMCDPRSDGHSIDHASDFARGMAAHQASGVPNKAFCLAVARIRAITGESVAEAARRASEAWYFANSVNWTPTSSFTDGCQGVVDAARGLEYTYTAEMVTALVQSWADVGVECGVRPELCDQDGTCDAAGGETCASCPEDCDSCSEDCGRWKKAKCKLGSGDCSRCGIPEGCGDGVCTGDETDDNCARDCGCAAPGATCGSVAPYGCWCDEACDDSQDCCEDADDICF